NTFNNIIANNASLSQADKQYLFTLTDDIYDYFTKQLSVPEYTSSVVNYILPSKTAGEFTPFVQKTPQNTSNLVYNNKSVNKVSVNSDTLFDGYESINLTNTSS